MKKEWLFNILEVFYSMGLYVLLFEYKQECSPTEIHIKITPQNPRNNINNTALIKIIESLNSIGFHVISINEGNYLKDNFFSRHIIFTFKD